MAATYDVWTWPGWGAISAWASVLALATVAVAAWRFVSQRQQAPIFHLDWSVVGTSNINGKNYHLVEFHNTGRGFGYIDVVAVMNGHVRLEEGYMAPKVLGSGQSFRILLTAPVIADVWLRTMTREPGRWTSMIFRWEPLLPQGELRDQWTEERELWHKRSHLQQWRDRYRPRAVGPGHQFVARIKAGGRIPVSVVFGEDRPPIVSNASAGNFSPSDLPYLGPAPTPKS